MTPITREAVGRFAREHLERLLPAGCCGRFFLAGGCFKSLIHGKAPNDLDLWPASAQDRALLLDSLQSQGSVVTGENDFHTILKNPVYKFHLEVTHKLADSVEECVADFDIQLACVAAEYRNGVVEGVYIHAGIADCIKHEEVRTVSRLVPMDYVLLTLARLDKYSKELGYHVCEKSRRGVWDVYTASSGERREALLNAAGLTIADVPQYAAIQRIFVDGRPSEPCRPFTKSELDALRKSLFQNYSDSPTSQAPVAVFVAGLPGAGKGTVVQEVLGSLGLSLKSMANLDMDDIRSYHGQYVEYMRGVPGLVHGQYSVYKELVPWFNEGSHAEQVLYQDDNSIVSDLLSSRRDFVLFVHEKNSLEFAKHVVSNPLGYVPILIEITVPVPVAMERAVFRAKVTGRYTPAAYIQESAVRLAEFLPAFKEFVARQPGGLVASFDNSREGGGGLGAPARRLG